MPLQGTFDVLDFTEVLHLIARHGKTGRLHVRHRSFGANVFFEAGQLTGADQSEHQTAASAGDVGGRLEEICFEMLEAERGSFEFQPGRASTLPVTSRHEVDTVLGQARTRLEHWRRLQEVIPSLELQPRLVGDLVRAEVTIDQERWRMLTAVDSRRNLRAIGRLLNLSDFDVCRVVAGLIDDGVVELDGLAALSAANRDAIPTVPGPAGTPPPSAHSSSDSVVVVAADRPGDDPTTAADGSRPGTDPEVPPTAIAADDAPATSAEEPPAGRGDPGDASPGSDPAPVDAGDEPSAVPEVDEGGGNDGHGPRRGRLVRIRSRQPRDAPG